MWNKRPDRKRQLLGWRAALRIALLLGLVVCLGGACSWNRFQEQFDEKFVFSPLMRVAANPDELLPEFAWADFACESLATGRMAGGGGPSAGGPPSCPT